MHLKDRGTGNSHDNTDLRYHQYKSDPVSQTALLGLRRPQGPCPSDSCRQLKLVGRHTLDASSAVATFRLHCITSLPANQCLLSRCTHAPPPLPQTLPHVTLCPGSLCCCNQEPTLVWEGVAGEVGCRKLDGYQSHRQQEPFPEGPSPPTPWESSTSRRCVLFTCATPQDTMGR